MQSWTPEAIHTVVRLCTELRNQEEALKGCLGGIKEGSFDDGWIVVKKKKKLKSFSALSQRFREFLMALFGLRFVSPGLNFSGPRCSQIQMGFNASPFSGPNTAGSASAGTNVHSILNDPEVRSLERLLRVKAKVENQGLPVRLPGRLLDKPPVSVVANKAGGRVPLLRAKSAYRGVGVMVARVCLRVMSLISPSTTPLLLQRMRLQV